jgi:gliding motility-associated-like protein
LAAGTYSVTVTDANGCEVIEAFTLINNVSGASVTAQDAQISCPGESDATVNYNVSLASGFAMPETVTITDNAGNIYTNGELSVGNYCIVVTDNNGCVAGEACFEVTAPTPIDLEVATTNVTCDNGGTITLIATGGTSSYTYAWNDGNTSANREDLAAGTYSVTIFDENDCTAEVSSIQITDDCDPICIEPVVMNTNITDVTCDNNDGEIMLEMQNPINAYIFAWSGSASTTNMATGLAAGNYVVTISNADDATCQTLLNIEVGYDCVTCVEPMVTNTIENDATCGNADGSITLEMENALNTYNFVWNDISATLNTVNFLATGTYTVTISNVNDATCQTILTIEIGDDCGGCNAPTVSNIIQNDATCGNADGTAVIAMPGNITDYNFAWSGNVSSSNTATGLAAGTYAVTVSLAADPTCQTIEAVIIGDDCTGNCDDPIVSNISTTNSNCDEATGSANISVQGATSDFTFAWTNNVSNNNIANGLAAGPYTVTVSNANDATCFTTETIVIENADGPTGTILTTANAVCGAANGTANLSPTNLTWTWVDGTTGASRNDLAAGTYFPTVTDANGCNNVIEVEIGQENNLTADINITANPNCGLPDGIANVTVNNSSGNYSFLWNDGNTAQSRTNLTSGTYSVLVVDNENGCEAMVDFVMTDNVSSAIVTVSDESVSCFGEADGMVMYEVEYEGGFAYSATIEIQDAAGNVATNGNLAIGNYCVIVTDANGCLAGNACFEITQPAQMTANATTENATCDDGGSITLELNGGTGNYTITWNDGQTGAIRTNLVAATYSVTILEENGCSQTLDNLIINDDCIPNCDQPVLANIIENEATCGNADGSATIEMTDDLTTLNFSWNGNSSTSNTAIGLIAGTYSVTISKTDNSDCQIVVNVTITEDCGTDCTNPVITNVDATDATCDENDGTATVTLGGNIADYSFEWSGGIAGNTNAATGLAAGIYSVTVYDAADNTCSTVQTITVDEDCIGGCDEPVVTNIETTDATCDNGGSATISMSGNAVDYQFVWSNGGDANTENNLNAGIYSVTIYDVTDPTCSTNVTIQINEDCDPTGGCTNPVIANVETTDATCDLSDGTATITVAGDISNYNFAWTGSASTSNVATNLAVGVYTVTVFDQSDAICNTTLIVQIGEDCVTGGCTNPVVADINTFDATCDETNGSAAIVMQGSASDFNYAWSGSVNTANFATNLAAGNYTVTITNATNAVCETIVNLEIGDDCIPVGNCDTPVVTNVDVTDTTCDENDGSATITMTTEVSNYNFAWSGGVNTSNVANQLATGIYTVTIYDATDATCSIIQTVQIGDDCDPTGNCIDPIVSTIETTDATCDNSGSATITMSGALSDYQFVWNNGLSANTATNLNAGIYSVTIYNATDLDCNVVLTIEINDDCNPVGCVDPIVFDIQTEDATCNTADGSVTIVMQGNAADFNFEWSGTGSTNNTAFGLAVGVYSVTISASNDADCNTTITVTIDDDCVTPPGCNEPIVTDIQTFDADCNTENGSVVLVLDGNPANYNYTWSNGNDNVNYANSLAAGDYTVTISDQTIANCQTVVNFTIAEDNCPTDCTEPIVTNINTTEATCGTANGSAAIETEGNIDSYTFTWTSLVNNTNSAAGLAAGTYSVTIADITDATCNTVVTIVIGTIDGPQVTVTSISAATCQAMNGQATFSDPSYEYLWSDGGTGFMRSDLAADIYQVTITDTNSGCFDVTEIEIEEDCDTNCDAPSVTNLVILEPDCGTTDGIITFEVMGDLSDYIFAWSPNSSNSNIATNLGAGIYTVTITRVDDATCFTEVDIIVPNSDTPNADVISTTNANCTAADGTATISPDLYDFTWSDGGTGAYRNNLAAGTYTVTVDDAGTACFTILELTIGQDSPLSGLATVNQSPDCGVANGDVTLTVNGGTGNYLYSWGTGNQQTNLASGTYTILVTDVDTGCSTDVDFVLNDDIIGATLILPSNTISVTCTGEANALLTYNLEFENGFNYPETITITDDLGNVATNGSLAPGDYCMAVTDAAECTAAQACFMVIEPAMLNVEVSVDNVTCDAAGMIQLQIFGGTPDAQNAYNIVWEDLPGTNGLMTRTDLAEGMYNVTITDENNCQVKVDIEITNDCDPDDCADIFGPDSGTLVTEYCDDASLCIPIAYTNIDQWTLTDFGNPFSTGLTGCNFDSLFTYSYASLPGAGNTGPYTVSSWNVNGTNHSGQFMTIEGLVAAMNGWDTTGEWTLDPSNSTISGGSNNTNYDNITVVQSGTSITAIMILNTNLVPQSTALILTPGEHDLLIVNGITGCMDSINLTVMCGAVNYLSDTLTLGVMDTICFNADWLPGNPQTIQNLCEDNSGDYVLFDIDGENCITAEAFDFGTEQACIVLCDDLGYCDTTYLTLTVVEPAILPDADDDAGDTYLDTAIDIEVLTNDTINGDLVDLFILDLPENGTVSTNNDGTITYTPNNGECGEDEPDQFTYTICNVNGCDTATVFVSIDCELFTILSGFSPNGDGINDHFHIEGIERLPENDLLIFNRWGNEVYRVKDYQNDWYGTFDGADLPEGTYFYIFDVKGEKVTGYVQIRR